jgi:hypothetical protein
LRPLDAVVAMQVAAAKAHGVVLVDPNRPSECA